MATVSGGQVILNNGQRVTPQTGGWYDGQQYWNGSLGSAGQFNAQNNQPGQQGGQAPVQNQNDANYLTKLGDTGAQNALVRQPTPSQPTNNTGSSTGGGVSMSSAPAAFDLVGATNAAYNTPEITAANQAVTDANTELTTRQQALADAQAGINDNPFYSEATRVGKSQQLTQQANADMTVIQNKATAAQNQVASLKSDAAIKVNAALGQYNINNQQYQQTLQQFNSLLQAGAITNMAPQDLAGVASATGIPFSELQSIQQTQQKNATKTAMITGSDGTISIIDTFNGNIISKTQPGVGAVSTPGGGLTTNESLTQTKDLVNNALGVLHQNDIISSGGSGDYQLSQQEKQQAYNQILALVGGDTAKAQKLFAQAWSQGGYKDYVAPSSGSGGGSGLLNNVVNWWSNLPGPSL